MAEKSSKSLLKKKSDRNFSSNHIHRKRPSAKFSDPPGKNVIYLNSHTHLKAFIERCDKLINKNQAEIIIYCLGAAISKGILLALKVCEKHVAYKLHTNTFTTTVKDDFEPIVDDADYGTQIRSKSGLRINLLRTDLLQTAEQPSNP